MPDDSPVPTLTADAYICDPVTGKPQAAIVKVDWQYVIDALGIPEGVKIFGYVVNGDAINLLITGDGLPVADDLDNLPTVQLRIREQPQKVTWFSSQREPGPLGH